MIYDPGNVMPSTRVYDVDANAEIGKVMEVNTQAGWIKVVDEPVRANRHDHLVTRRIRFERIYPIKGLEVFPCLFHCYGRKV